MIVWIFFTVIVILIIAAKSIKIVRPWQKGLIERLGKYRRTAGSGLTTIIPFIENIKLTDMREQVVDVPPQAVITKDNVAVEVDAVIYHEITDPVKVNYNVVDFLVATTKLAQTNLRNVIGDMSLDESLTSRETINAKLRDILDLATDKWGTKITRVEIQRIEPPSDVTEAMHKQMKAERERRAMIATADGQREAAIKVAEGDKQSKILRAEGEAESIKRIAEADRFEQLTVAEGEAQAIQKVFSAIHKGQPTNDLLAIKYLEALKGIADGKATKIFLPLDSSGILGSIAGIAELFKEREQKKAVEAESPKSEGSK
jgi:regulator of protease activity HflC (stomatin/prohibitin superfamily)